MAARTPRAIGRSKPAPSFFISAGAKFMVILRFGKSKPEFFIADLTLSFDSFTAVSGRQTILMAGRPLHTSTSISISLASIPTTAEEYILESI